MQDEACAETEVNVKASGFFSLTYKPLLQTQHFLHVCLNPLVFTAEGRLKVRLLTCQVVVRPHVFTLFF